NRRTFGTGGIEFISFGMGDYKITVPPGVDPLRETIGNALRKSLHVWRRRQYDLGSALFLLEDFGTGHKVCKTLKRMQRCAFEANHGDPGVFNELLNILFAVVLVSVAEGRECPDSQNIKVFTEDGGCILNMLHRCPI